MVSVTLLVVSVWLVILPCVKFGTTGTARTGAVVLTTSTPVTVSVVIFPKWMLTRILHYRIVISVTNCPVALEPAPPPVKPMVCLESIVPARLPAVPAAVEVCVP